MSELVAKTFEQFVHSECGKHVKNIKLNTVLKRGDGFQREFDVYYETSENIVAIECLSFVNTKTPKDIINRYDREEKKIKQIGEQREFLERKYPEKNIHIFIASNSRTNNEQITCFKDDTSIFEKLIEVEKAEKIKEAGLLKSPIMVN